jgi:hypothetical protein
VFVLVPLDGDRFAVRDRSGRTLFTGTRRQAVAEVERRLSVDEVTTGGVPFRTLIAPLGVETDDVRRIVLEADGFAARSAPLPLMWQTVTAPEHDGAVLAGHIDRVWIEGSELWGSGRFDPTPEGEGAVEDLRNRASDDHPGGRFGVSVDLSKADGDFECDEEDEDGYCVAGWFRATAWEVMGATGTPFPAFAGAYIELVDEGSEDAEAADAAVASARTDRNEAHYFLAAAGAPVSSAWGEDGLPPAEWFEDPQLDRPTPLTVTPDGRVFGHLAAWGTCHVGFDGVCLTPPRSAMSYSRFRQHATEVRCEPCLASGGDTVRTVRTGRITMGTGHAPVEGVTPLDVLSHYDHTGTAAADVAAGEDEHGIWLAGAVDPRITVDDLRVLRGSSVSGDWRRVPGVGLELHAVLAVNVPGFPFDAPEVQVASGRPLVRVEDFETVALVAALSPARTSQDADPEADDRIAAMAEQLARLETELLVKPRRAALVASVWPGDSRTAEQRRAARLRERIGR